ncbi:MAG TPA: hypothetical protein VHK63_00995 [Candidatus Limnocylindria bacterium]|nr:hypothetical protein [Candidatus Limnocylindria bacterium]
MPSGRAAAASPRRTSAAIEPAIASMSMATVFTSHGSRLRPVTISKDRYPKIAQAAVTA